MKAQDGKFRETDTLDTEGYTLEWIEHRIKTIINRKKLTFLLSKSRKEVE